MIKNLQQMYKQGIRKLIVIEGDDIKEESTLLVMKKISEQRIKSYILIEDHIYI